MDFKRFRVYANEVEGKGFDADEALPVHAIRHVDGVTERTS